MKSYLLLFGCLSILVLKGLWLLYLGVNLSGRVSFAVFIALEALTPVSAGFFLGVIATIRALFFSCSPGPSNRILLWGALGYTLLGLSPATQSWDSLRQGIVLGRLFPLYNGVNASIIAWGLMVALIRLPSIEAPRLKRRIKAFLGLWLAFFPFLMRDLFLFNGPDELYRIDVFPLFFPIPYLVVGVATIVACGRHHVSEPLSPPAMSQSDRDLDGLVGRLDLPRDLTPRERELIPLILRGLGNKEMAAILGISPKTINNHLSNLYRKLGIQSRFEFIGQLFHSLPR